MNENVMFDLSDKLRSLKDEKTEIDQKLEKVKKQISTVESQLLKLMTEAEIPSFTRQGRIFSISISPKASAIAGLKDELHKTLKAQGYGSLAKEAVNPQSLSSFVKEQIAENNDKLPSWLEGLVNIYEKTSIGVRKSTGKSCTTNLKK
ncbi:MAG: hypothetical protein LBR79_07215 [Oscillospiraceae bacterium]|jgi:predicted  nucleic acid-binding Zn-ribbon protein|nr:hypothetical protein [Oscillospiraceae bacterium]